MIRLFNELSPRAKLNVVRILPFGIIWFLFDLVFSISNYSATGNYLRPFGSTAVVPLSQRLFLGGRYSLRGFSKNEVGPRGEDSNIVGGDSSVVMAARLRFGLTKKGQGSTVSPAPAP